MNRDKGTSDSHCDDEKGVRKFGAARSKSKSRDL